MDNLWKDTGADLFVIPYRVVATGSNAGMIEVVPKSRTTAEIHKVIAFDYFNYFCCFILVLIFFSLIAIRRSARGSERRSHLELFERNKSK